MWDDWGLNMSTHTLSSRSPLFVRRISTAIRAWDRRSDMGQKLSICFVGYGYRFVICNGFAFVICGCGCGCVFAFLIWLKDLWWTVEDVVKGGLLWATSNVSRWVTVGHDGSQWVTVVLWCSGCLQNKNNNTYNNNKIITKNLGKNYVENIWETKFWYSNY